MARTPLFSKLRRLLRTISSAPTPTVDPKARLTHRRDLLKAAGFGVPTAVLAACGDDTEPPPGDEDPIVIVGAGIAGLHCAYRLKEAGVKAFVYEGQDRVGGRMWSAVGKFPAAPDQLCEIGGELIDTDHETLHTLAAQLGLALDDRLTEEDAGFQRDTWYVNGVSVPEATIIEQFTEVAPTMAADLEAADSDEAAYATLDATTLDAYLVATVPPATYPELHAVLQAAYRGEYGLENDQQSALNLIYLIGSDDPDPFRIFGTSDERYHTHLGNESFPQGLAALLDEDQIVLEHKLTKAADAGAGFELTFDGPDGEVTVKASRIVFALPFTKLREVDLTGLTLSEEKREIIDTLGYGTNAKVMLGFDTRVWRTDHDASGSLTTDLSIQQTWETTVGQAGDHGILTNFTGGQGGLDSGEGEPTDWAAMVLPDLETVWPGTQAAFDGTAVRMHWPTFEWSKGSYACYTPGQWSFFGLEGVREGMVHFCGEHTSQDHQGYMEGGAETGGLVAAEILEDLDLSQPQGLVDALGVKLLIPQACYRADRTVRLSPFARRRLARARVAEAMRRLADLEAEAARAHAHAAAP